MKKGFIDLQVNGYQGVDFAVADLSPSTIDQVTQALVQKGTLGYLATLITSSIEIYRSNLPLLARACGPHLLGIHLEGPFVSSKDGARGAHPKAHTQNPDLSLAKELFDLCQGHLKLVTLAPELPGATDLISFFREQGVTVSLGHHLAKSNEISSAVSAGASCITHLGNGLPKSLNRHPNVLWDQLAQDRLTAMMITDGKHTYKPLVKVALAAKGTARFIVVSDQSPLAGCPPGIYTSWGNEVKLDESGAITLTDSGYLSGSSLTMIENMNVLAGYELLTQEELWQVGYENPLQLVGVKLNPNDYQHLPDVVFVNQTFGLNPI